jgi:hypothetical protein
MREQNQARGFPYDGPADMNTARMMVKLYRHNPAFYEQFKELGARHGANYYRYNPVSHSFELYTHRQVYLATYQLPEGLRSRKVVGPIQHRGRYTGRAGATDIYYSGAEGIERNRGLFVERPGYDRVR